MANDAPLVFDGSDNAMAIMGQIENPIALEIQDDKGEIHSFELKEAIVMKNLPAACLLVSISIVQGCNTLQPLESRRVMLSFARNELNKELQYLFVPLQEVIDRTGICSSEGIVNLGRPYILITNSSLHPYTLQLGEIIGYLRPHRTLDNTSFDNPTVQAQYHFRELGEQLDPVSDPTGIRILRLSTAPTRKTVKNKPKGVSLNSKVTTNQPNEITQSDRAIIIPVLICPPGNDQLMNISLVPGTRQLLPMSKRDTQVQFTLLHDAFVIYYNKHENKGPPLSLLTSASPDAYELMRSAYNTWASQIKNMVTQSKYLSGPRHTCPRCWSVLDISNLRRQSVTEFNDLPFADDPLQTNLVVNAAQAFWTNIWSGEIPLSLGQPLPNPSLKTFRSRIPWGPQPFPLIIEDVTTQDPTSTSVLCGLDSLDHSKAFFCPSQLFKAREYVDNIRHENILLEAPYPGFNHTCHSPSESIIRSCAFHSPYLIDNFGTIPLKPSDIMLATHNMPDHVPHDPWVKTIIDPDKIDPSPETGYTISSNIASILTSETVSDIIVEQTINESNSAHFDIPLTNILAKTIPEVILPNISENLPPEIQIRFKTLLKRFEKVFIRDFSGPPWTSHLHEIRLKPDAHPRGRAPFRLPQAHLAVLQATLDKWLEEGVVTPSESPWAAPAFFVPKPDGSLRLVIDYRYLNSHTIPDRFPLPLPEELLGRLHGAEMFSSFDAHSGFTQQAMHPNSRYLTAFITPIGLFQFTRLSMGLRNGPASFSRGMSFMSHDLEGMLVYLDDVNIYTVRDKKDQSDNALYEKHYNAVSKFLQRCSDTNLRLNGKKCFVGESEIKFLGHWVSVNGIRPDAGKIKAVETMATPRNTTDLSCTICAERGTTRDRPKNAFPIENHPLVSRPFQRISIDLMGPFPSSKSGNVHIAVAVDHFTKWTLASPLPSKEARETADFLVKDIVFIHGAPDLILTDNGLEFKNELNKWISHGVVHGRECRTPLDTVIPSVPRFKSASALDYAESFISGLAFAKDIALEKLEIFQQMADSRQAGNILHASLKS
eukprot:gene29945-39121_t